MDAAHVRTESNARRALSLRLSHSFARAIGTSALPTWQSGPLTGAAGGKGHGFAWQAPRDNVCPSKGKSLRGVDFFTRPPGAIDDRPASARQIPTEESLPRLVWACPAPGDEPLQRSAPGVRRRRTQTQRATLQHAGAQSMTSPCRRRPRLPRPSAAGADDEKLFGAFSGIPRQHASFHIIFRTPFRDARAATARRLSRHLSLFLRSPWTAFSFLA